MSFGLNLTMLLGLGAVLIPLLIHLLHRRRFVALDWGAMQFLQISATTQKRIWLEELLLLLLRMGLIAVLVLALAAPYLSGHFLSFLARPQRDVVVLIDGSYSMGFTPTLFPLKEGEEVRVNSSPFQAAKEWARTFVHNLQPGDRAALVLVRNKPLAVVPELSANLDLVLARIDSLPGPRGGSDWPGAVEWAVRLLAKRDRSTQAEIVILRDRQHYSWADPETLKHWETLSDRLRAAQDHIGSLPPIWVAEFGSFEGEGPNYALEKIRGNRILARIGQKLSFKSALTFGGMKEWVPPRIRLEVNGRSIEDLQIPSQVNLTGGQISLTFHHLFSRPGTHLISAMMNTEPVRDCLPGDNRQDLAVEVVSHVPVLLVDGDDSLSAQNSTYFLARALTPPPSLEGEGKESGPTVVTWRNFSADWIGQLGNNPRVIILADVPRLDSGQMNALEKFLEDGGGLWVILGHRADPLFYNEQLYRKGKGWLPGLLEEPMGDLAQPDQAMRVDLPRVLHPVLELFREGSLGQARFPRWWQITLPDKLAPAARFSNRNAFLVEKPYHHGRVFLSTVPMDRSWESNFTRMGEFPVFVHEMVYYLAEARSGNFNLLPGQPFRFHPSEMLARKSGPTRLTLQPPEGDIQTLMVERWPWIYGETWDTGIYRIQMEEREAYFVVHGDPRESDLTLGPEKDRQKVKELFLMKEVDPSKAHVETPGDPPVGELWWLCLTAVMLMLCLEIWHTRRMLARREAPLKMR